MVAGNSDIGGKFVDLAVDVGSVRIRAGVRNQREAISAGRLDSAPGEGIELDTPVDRRLQNRGAGTRDSAMALRVGGMLRASFRIGLRMKGRAKRGEGPDKRVRVEHVGVQWIGGLSGLV